MNRAVGVSLVCLFCTLLGGSPSANAFPFFRTRTWPIGSKASAKATSARIDLYRRGFTPNRAALVSHGNASAHSFPLVSYLRSAPLRRTNRGLNIVDQATRAVQQGDLQSANRLIDKMEDIRIQLNTR